MSLSDDVKNVLAADAFLLGLVSTRIYTRKELSRLGVTVDTELPIFDSDLVMQPSIIVALRDELPTGDIDDTGTQEQSVAQVVEVYFYDDGDHGFDVIAQARKRTFGLLYGQHVGKYILLKPTPDTVEKYDKLIQYACFERSDFTAYTVKNNDIYDY